MTEINQKQIDYLLHIIALSLSIYEPRKKDEIESTIKKRFNDLGDV